LKRPRRDSFEERSPRTGDDDTSFDDAIYDPEAVVLENRARAPNTILTKPCRLMNGSEFITEISLQHVGGADTLYSIPLKYFPGVNIIITHRITYDKLSDKIPKQDNRVIFAISDDGDNLRNLHMKYRNPAKPRAALARCGGQMQAMFLLPMGRFAKGVLDDTPGARTIPGNIWWIGVCKARVRR